MGRTRKQRKDLPRRVYFHHGRYWFYPKPLKGQPSKRISLGVNFAAAMEKYVKLAEPGGSDITMEWLFDQYLLLESPKKGERTQKDERTFIAALRPVFGRQPYSHVEPIDCVRYHAKRSQAAPVRANREINCLSRVFNFGLNTLKLAITNPTSGVKRNPEVGRTRSPTLDELAAFKAVCVEKYNDQLMPLYVDLKLLIGLRVGDMLRLTRSMIKEDRLSVTFNKSRRGSKGHVIVVQEFFFVDEDGNANGLKELLDQLQTLNGNVRSMFLFCHQQRNYGQPYTVDGWQTLWWRRMQAFIARGSQRFAEHDIRPTAADQEEQSGGDAQRLLGHADAKTTRIYLRHKRPIRVTPAGRKHSAKKT